jgi:hypothetical protein
VAIAAAQSSAVKERDHVLGEGLSDPCGFVIGCELPRYIQRPAPRGFAVESMVMPRSSHVAVA